MSELVDSDLAALLVSPSDDNPPFWLRLSRDTGSWTLFFLSFSHTLISFNAYLSNLGDRGRRVLTPALSLIPA